MSELSKDDQPVIVGDTSRDLIATRHRSAGVWNLRIGVFLIRSTNYPVTHDLFPSGPWTGFYNYSPKDKHRMDLDLTFATGRLSGDGKDDVGHFKVHGSYDTSTLECWWTKAYLGAHAVFYRGFREGNGIWGTWEISPHHHGGFHIWPKGDSVGDAETAVAEKERTVEEVAPVGT